MALQTPVNTPIAEVSTLRTDFLHSRRNLGVYLDFWYRPSWISTLIALRHPLSKPRITHVSLRIASISLHWSWSAGVSSYDFQSLDHSYLIDYIPLGVYSPAEVDTIVQTYRLYIKEQTLVTRAAIATLAYLGHSKAYNCVTICRDTMYRLNKLDPRDTRVPRHPQSFYRYLKELDYG